MASGGLWVWPLLSVLLLLWHLLLPWGGPWWLCGLPLEGVGDEGLLQCAPHSCTQASLTTAVQGCAEGPGGTPQLDEIFARFDESFFLIQNLEDEPYEKPQRKDPLICKLGCKYGGHLKSL